MKIFSTKTFSKAGVFFLLVLVGVYVVTWNIDPYVFGLAVFVQSLVAAAFLIWGIACILVNAEKISPSREIIIGLLFFSTLVATVVAWFVFIGINWA